MSHYARPSGKALKPSHLHQPTNMPSRADPTSEDARLYGPLSKRRQVNIRWRYFSHNWKRLYPPIEIPHQETRSTPSQEGSAPDAGIRGVGLQGVGLLEELKMLAGEVSQRPITPRRIDSVYGPKSPSNASDRGPLPNRYLRRRYRELLGRIPILTRTNDPGGQKTATEANARSKYEVSLATNALSQRVQHEVVHSSEVDAVDLAWLLHRKSDI